MRSGHRQELDAFLSSAFGVQDLRDWVRLNCDPEISLRLPPEAAMTPTVRQLVELLEQRGCIDADFFSALTKARPRRHSEIDGLARRILGASWPTGLAGPGPHPTARGYLKDEVAWRRGVYACVAGSVLAWLNLFGISFAPSFSATTIGAWVASGAVALATLGMGVLDALPSVHLKTVLVFWRTKDPLPSARAFEKAYLEEDSRISIPGLRAQLGGKLPRGKEQHTTWYRLYRSVQQVSEVARIHRDYLLYRDLLWCTAVLTTMALFSLVVNWTQWAELLVFIGVATLIGVALSRAAAERGNRFVRTVLAVIGSYSTDNISSPSPKEPS